MKIGIKIKIYVKKKPIQDLTTSYHLNNQLNPNNYHLSQALFQ